MAKQKSVDDLKRKMKEEMRWRIASYVDQLWRKKVFGEIHK